MQLGALGNLRKLVNYKLGNCRIADCKCPLSNKLPEPMTMCSLFIDVHRWRCSTGPTSTRLGTPSCTSPSASTARTCWRDCSPTSRPTRCRRPTAAGASSTCLPTWRPTWPPPSGDTCRRRSGSGRGPSPASTWPNGPPIHCRQVSNTRNHGLLVQQLDNS